jgi:hypothetical protein
VARTLQDSPEGGIKNPISASQIPCLERLFDLTQGFGQLFNAWISSQAIDSRHLETTYQIDLAGAKRRPRGRWKDLESDTMGFFGTNTTI